MSATKEHSLTGWTKLMSSKRSKTTHQVRTLLILSSHNRPIILSLPMPLPVLKGRLPNNRVATGSSPHRRQLHPNPSKGRDCQPQPPHPPRGQLNRETPPTTRHKHSQVLPKTTPLPPTRLLVATLPRNRQLLNNHVPRTRQQGQTLQEQRRAVAPQPRRPPQACQAAQ